MTPKLPGRLALLAATLALLAAACGSDPTATPTRVLTATPPPEAATPLSEATPTGTPDEAARFEAEWDALIRAAQEEGEVVLVFGGSAGQSFRPVAAIFEQKFGIKPVIATGSGSAHVNRVLAEREVGRYLVDVMYGGATSVNTRMIPANALHPMPDLFIHPEVTDQSLWYGGRHWYSDTPQQFLFTFAATAGSQSLSMRYNTDLVTPEDVENFNSVFDYLDPKWKGKIVANPPIGGGGAGTFYTAYVHPDIGKEWIDGFLSLELDVTFSDSRSFVIDGIARGKFAMGIAIGGSGGDLDALGDLGAPVKRLVKQFSEGGVLDASGSIANFSVPTRQPHPNATRLWVNWWLSKEGQTLMHTESNAVPEPTLREDVTDFGKTPESFRRVEGESYYFFDTDPEFVKKRQEAFDYAADVYRAARAGGG